MTKVFVDTETCGLYGMPILIQYAADNGDIEMFSPWKEPIYKTLELIDWFCLNDFIGFNIAFDWFHVCKLYTTFSLFPDREAIPEKHIDELAVLEERARLEGLCVKPKRAFDLMLHARKGPYQSLMGRDDIKIKRIPAVLADKLALELEQRVQLDGIYFAGRKDKNAPRWKVMDNHDPITRKLDPNFKNIILNFRPSGALKTLAEHIGLADKATRFRDIQIDRELWPEELGWAPFALAIGKPGKWNKAWPQVIQYHIDHWHYNQLARQYASNDIVYTRGLYKHFKEPEPGDDDSELACMVAAVRWRGLRIKANSMKAMKITAQQRYKGVPIAPGPVKAYLHEVMSDSEITVTQGSTKKNVLEELAESQCDCVLCDESPDKCELCGGSGLRPVAERATRVIKARQGKKEEEIYDKLLDAGRFHASFVVIGTLSSRMAGSDGLNPQGIKHTDEVRDCFPLADPGFILCGGDFDAFEVVLADATYNDPTLREALLADKKIHALFGMEMFECSYEDVMRSKGTENDMYTKGKQGVFALIYGGDWNTLVVKQRVKEEVAKKAYDNFLMKYPEIAKSRQQIIDQFCSMRQPVAGGQVIWHEPADYIESLFGFRRYFTLENKICKALFDLAEKPPKEWSDLKIKVVRRQDRGAQTASGATRSALFGAAFAIQAAAMRAAANHVIQSSGATITKHVQRRIWDIQPPGANEWRVVPLNIHDEILTPTRPEYIEEVERTVQETVDSFRDRVPLLKMEWDNNLESWSKGMTEGKVRKMRALQAEGKSLDEICQTMKMKSDELRTKAKDILAGTAWDWIKSETTAIEQPSALSPSIAS